MRPEIVLSSLLPNSTIASFCSFNRLLISSSFVQTFSFSFRRCSVSSLSSFLLKHFSISPSERNTSISSFSSCLLRSADQSLPVAASSLIWTSTCFSSSVSCSFSTYRSFIFCNRSLPSTFPFLSSGISSTNSFPTNSQSKLNLSCSILLLVSSCLMRSLSSTGDLLRCNSNLSSTALSAVRDCASQESVWLTSPEKSTMFSLLGFSEFLSSLFLCRLSPSSPDSREGWIVGFASSGLGGHSSEWVPPSPSLFSISWPVVTASFLSRVWHAASFLKIQAFSSLAKTLGSVPSLSSHASSSVVPSSFILPGAFFSLLSPFESPSIWDDPFSFSVWLSPESSSLVSSKCSDIGILSSSTAGASDCCLSLSLLFISPHVSLLRIDSLFPNSSSLSTEFSVSGFCSFSWSSFSSSFSLKASSSFAPSLRWGFFGELSSWRLAGNTDLLSASSESSFLILLFWRESSWLLSSPWFISSWGIPVSSFSSFKLWCSCSSLSSDVSPGASLSSLIFLLASSCSSPFKSLWGSSDASLLPLTVDDLLSLFSVSRGRSPSLSCSDQFSWLALGVSCISNVCVSMFRLDIKTPSLPNWVLSTNCLMPLSISFSRSFRLSRSESLALANFLMTFFKLSLYSP